MTQYFEKTLHFLFMAACLLFFVPSGAYSAEKAPSSAEVTATEINAVITALENQEEREKLIRTLKLLAETQQTTAPGNDMKSATAQVLQSISAKVGDITRSIMQVTSFIYEIPQGSKWFRDQLKEPESRRMWREVAINLALTLGLGYAAFYLFRLMLYRAHRSLSNTESSVLPLRIARLLAILTFNLLPILAFTIAAYATLSIISPHEETRLVALAWINCFIISHVIISLLAFIFAPEATKLRLTGLSDENANYLMIWGKRLTFTALYGYFSLQAALLLGLPAASYAVFLRLLGLHVTALVIIMILQNREEVSQYMLQLSTAKKKTAAEVKTGTHDSFGLWYRLAKTWHILAIFYVIVMYSTWALRVSGGFLFLFRATILTALSLLLVKAVIVALRAFFNMGFRLGEDLKRRFPSLEVRTNRYISSLHTGCRAVTYFFGAITILQAWGFNTFDWIGSEPAKVLGGTIISVFATILVTFVIWEIANSIIENSITKKDATGTQHEASPRIRTLLTVARKALAIVLIIISSLMVLSEMGVNIAPLLAGAGVLGLAIGFGSQKLVQDVITGIFILIEDQIAVGDVIDLGGKSGVVEAVSIRTVRLRDVSGTVHTIPFSGISTVSNMTKDFSFAVLEVGIAYRESVDDVIQVLRDLGSDLQSDPEYGDKILEPLEVLGVDSFADSAVIIKARIKTVPTKQWWVGREYKRRMKNRFDELDIEIPFPHQTIYFGIDKKGTAAPARLAIQPDLEIKATS